MIDQEPQQPVVSVIVPAFNASRFVDDCLESVFRQRGPFTLDVIVVDDGSTDDTAARIRASPLPLRCIGQANLGPAAARNVAIRQARGRYVAFLDSDDLWPPGKLARQLAILESRADVGLVFGDARQFDAAGPAPVTLFQEARYDLAFWGDPLYVVNAYGKLLQGNFITTGSVMMRRSVIERVGCFDERLRLVEDFEYWLRVARACPVAHLDDVCLLRHRHEENTSRDAIAMAIAGIAVMEEQARRHRAEARAQGADLRKCIARDYQNLGHLYMRRAAYGHAVRAYLRALRGAPGIRLSHHLVSAIAAWACARAGGSG